VRLTVYLIPVHRLRITAATTPLPVYLHDQYSTSCIVEYLLHFIQYYVIALFVKCSHGSNKTLKSSNVFQESGFFFFFIKWFRSTSGTVVYLLPHTTVRISSQQSVLWDDETMCIEFMIVHFGLVGSSRSYGNYNFTAWTTFMV
jgi:hypothetical protein